MNYLLRNTKKAKIVRRLIIAVCFAFMAVSLVNRHYSRATTGGDYSKAVSFNGVYPLFLHPHWDDSQPDMEKLTFRRSIFHQFKDTGEIRFHVNKFKEAESYADGVTLEVYADGKLIASKLENPYTSPEYPYSDDNMYHSVIFDFDIPENTHDVSIIAKPNGNTSWDHVYIEYFTGIKSNTAIKVLFFLVALLLFSSVCIEWVGSFAITKSKGTMDIKDGTMQKRRALIFYPFIFIIMLMTFFYNTFKTGGMDFDNFESYSSVFVIHPIVSGHFRSLGAFEIEGKIFYNGGQTYWEDHMQPLKNYMTPLNITDINWNRGINRRSAGLVVNNNMINREYNRVGAIASFKNGSQREIAAVDQSGQYLNVWFKGDDLLNKNIGYPYMYRTNIDIKIVPYISQAGIATYFFTLLSKLHPPVWFYKLFVVSMLVLVLSFISRFIVCEFGYKYASLFVLACILSRWLVMMGKHLYWQPWLFFLPMLFMIIYLKTGKEKYAWLVFVSLIVKFLNGYEYITSVCIAMCVPLVYCSVKKNWKYREIGKKFGAWILIVLLAFVISIVITGSLKDHSFRHLLSRGVTRTISEANEAHTKVSVINNLRIYLTDKPFVNFPVPIWVLLGVSLVSCASLIRSNKDKEKALGISTLFSVLAPLSWFVIARQHSHIHTHINHVLWCVPFIPMAFMSIFAAFNNFWRKGE